MPPSATAWYWKYGDKLPGWTYIRYGYNHPVSKFQCGYCNEIMNQCDAPKHLWREHGTTDTQDNG
ncbi:Protein of unknown function [Pyronema omphalodes CBS 100304]|uniref:Uncharacterized protein n=1 Tax=Pyronema omphalodes (strain CBS 100304) TaxID=1076935 RepID=U4KZY8_PYROM|nr:Protein of unknown function [Pyronema omphalodes CBS 100304]